MARRAHVDGLNRRLQVACTRGGGRGSRVCKTAGGPWERDGCPGTARRGGASAQRLTSACRRATHAAAAAASCAAWGRPWSRARASVAVWCSWGACRRGRARASDERVMRAWTTGKPAGRRRYSTPWSASWLKAWARSLSRDSPPVPQPWSRSSTTALPGAEGRASTPSASRSYPGGAIHADQAQACHAGCLHGPTAFSSLTTREPVLLPALRRLQERGLSRLSHTAPGRGGTPPRRLQRPLRHKRAPRVHPHAAREAAGSARGDHQTRQPLPAVCGCPAPGVQGAVRALQGLCEPRHAARRKAGRLGHASHARGTVVTKTRANP